MRFPMAGAKILLVDDTRLNRELAKDLLEMEGYQIIEAIPEKNVLKKLVRINLILFYWISNYPT